MITKPAIPMPYQKVEDLVGAEDLTTVVEYGVIAIDNMRDSDDPAMREIMANTIKMQGGHDWSSSCFQTRVAIQNSLFSVGVNFILMGKMRRGTKLNKGNPYHKG